MKSKAAETTNFETPFSNLAQEFDQDVGDIAHLEHINLEVTDIEGGINVVWFNIGRQQFHIAKGPKTQQLPNGGAIMLVLPNVMQIAAQLEAVSLVLGDISISHMSPTMLEVTDPFGNHYIVKESVDGFPWKAGIANILLPCFKGTSAQIANFYESCLGAIVQMPGSTRAEINLGAGTKLTFVEDASLGEVTDEGVRALASGWHMALYNSRFSHAFRMLETQAKTTGNNHPYKDKFMEIREGSPNHGQLIYSIAHEIRSMHHPQCFKDIYNR
eukprot:gene20990-27848_t